MHSELYPALYAPKGGYVFVVTYGRSGSTLTQNLLNAIPGYQIRGENGNALYHLARAAVLTSKWNDFVWRREDRFKAKADQRVFIRDIIGTSSDPWFGAELVDPSSLSKSLANSFVSEFLNPDPSTRVSGFKEIRWHEDRGFFPNFLSFIKSSFPNSKFIFQTRNGSEVAGSGWWKNKDKDSVLDLISKAENLYGNFIDENPDISFKIEYERYMEGVSYVRKIYDFLGEDVSKRDIESILEQKLRH